MTNTMRGWWLAMATLGALIAGTHATLASPVAVSEFTFQGVCGDCTGFGTGDLILQNYTQGTAANIGHFVSFHYTSNLITYTIGQADIASFNGVLGPALPAPEDIGIFSNAISFFSQASGFWCTGGGCVGDFGAANLWSTADIGVPEPLSITLLGAGLVGLGVVRRRTR